jgi:hypothetical protein
MRKNLIILAAATFAFMGAQSAFADQLVTNGGFETGDFTGWTLTGPATTSSNPSGFYGVDTLDAASGTYGAYLGSDFTTPLTLMQTLTVAASHNYTINFTLAQDVAPSTGFGNSFLVTFGGQTIFSETNAPVSGFTTYSFNVTTSSASTGTSPLDFISENSLGYFSLDNVSVSTTTPEPASFLLVIPALGLLALRRRKVA